MLIKIISCCWVGSVTCLPSLPPTPQVNPMNNSICWTRNNYFALKGIKICSLSTVKNGMLLCYKSVITFCNKKQYKAILFLHPKLNLPIKLYFTLTTSLMLVMHSVVELYEYFYLTLNTYTELVTWTKAESNHTSGRSQLWMENI